MADTTLTPSGSSLWSKVPKVPAFAALILLALLVLDPLNFVPVIQKTLMSFGHTLPFLIFAVMAVSYVKATGAEAMLAKAFEGREIRMIFLAAAAGGLSPFCSCEVIPFIAGLLAVGAPLSAVMAFWIASPLMDPAMFAITAGAISTEFAVAKLVFTLLIGTGAGFATMALKTSPVFNEPLREQPVKKGCGCGPAPFSGKPVWAFWTEAKRSAVFKETTLENGLFLGQWLLLAYLLEALMLTYVPPELISQMLGGTGPGPVFLGALLGAPAYLNGYAAAGLVGALIDQGMAGGAGMAFMIAGGVTCIPAAVAVWPLVKPRVFAAYIGYGFVGALFAGFAWNALFA
ncbi:MAG: permease [Pseudomonadota bacterium]